MSVNLVNGDTLNSDFTAICNKIREKTGDANTIAYAPGNPTNIVDAIDSISGGGGTNEIFNPIFTETLLADDSSLTGTLDFNGADYHDYPLLKVVVYDTSAQQDLVQLVVPSSFDVALQYFSSGVCFGRYNSSVFAYYKTDSSGNWIKGNSDRIYVKKVYGLEGQNCNITTTNIYIGSSNSAINQTISYADKLSNFNMLVAMCNNSTSDCEPSAYALSGCGSIKDYLANFANSWSGGVEVTVTDYEISSYYWFSVDGVTLTAKQDSIQFSETLICDNTSLSTGNLTFSDSYTNYDFLRFEIYDTNNQTIFYVSTLPEIVTNIKTRGSGYINFATPAVSWSSARYTISSVDDKEWTRITSQPYIIKTVYGIRCTNRTVIKDVIYNRPNSSSSSVTIEPVQSLWEYSSLYFSSVNDSYSENLPCLAVFDINLQGMVNLVGANLYAENLLSAATRILYIYEHSITNNSYLGDVVGVKFG